MTAERSLTPSTLGRMVGKSPTDQAAIRRMAADLFHRDDDPWIVGRLSEFKTQNKRQAAIALGEELYGPRRQKDVTA